MVHVRVCIASCAAFTEFAFRIDRVPGGLLNLPLDHDVWPECVAAGVRDGTPACHLPTLQAGPVSAPDGSSDA